LAAGISQAATWEISSGNWESIATWHTGATGSPVNTVYDNGAIPPDAVLGGTPGSVNWTIDDTGILGNPPAQTGVWSGTLETDDYFGLTAVTGGSITATGTIGKEIRVGQNSWWYIQYTDLTIDFDSGSATAAGGVQCWDSLLAPASCSFVLTGEPDVWAPLGGNEGAAGTARMAATLDIGFTPEGTGSSTLSIFHEGFGGPGPGSDYLHTLTLYPVPVPGAVWLFGSALVGLAWTRRKLP